MFALRFVQSYDFSLAKKVLLDFRTNVWYNILDSRRSKYYNEKGENVLNNQNTSSNSASDFYKDFQERTNKRLSEIISANTPKVGLSLLNSSSSASKSSSGKSSSNHIPTRTGSSIKNNIRNVLSLKQGPLNTKNLFDDIDDETVENNIPTAESTIKSNISKGFLPADYQKRFPNLLDGLSLSYAAAEKGNNKAATKAREAAYMEDTSFARKQSVASKPEETQKNETDFDDLLKNGKLPSLFNGYSNNSKTEQKNSEKRYVGVESGNLNLRSAPGTTNAILDKMPRGTEVDFTGNKTTVSGNQWAEVVHNGNKGWVDASFLKIAQPESATSPADTSRTDKFSDTRFLANILKNKSTDDYDILYNNLSEKDKKAGIVVDKVNDANYYDYTNAIMRRINEVLPEFINHKIISYDDYYNKNQGLFKPDPQRYNAQVLGNLAFFFSQVNHGAPWDIKRDKPWKQQFGEIKMPYYDSNPQKDEKFIFRGKLVTREDLGNILYGYLGSAMGIGDITLYWGAGVAADEKNIINGKAYDSSQYYGDNKEDHDFVKKGIEMFYEDFPDSKPGINRTFP